MSLRTRLRIWIVTLVTIVVVAISAMYFYDFTTIAFESANRRAELVADQVRDYVLERVNQQSAARGTPSTTLAESKALWTNIVQTDPNIRAMLLKTMTNADTVVDIHITGENGAVLVGSGPILAEDSVHATSFADVKRRSPFRNVWDLFTKSENYYSSIPLGVSGQGTPLFHLVVMIRSSLLWTSLLSAIHNLGLAFVITFPVAVALALALPGFVLSPLEQLGRRIDALRSEEFEASETGSRKPQTREFAAVESKLDMLGQQFKGAKQDALQLRGNIEEMLQRLEEAVLLFDAGGRVMIAGPPAERLLGRDKGELVGRHREEIFPPGTFLGALIAEAFQQRTPVRDRIVPVRDAGERRGRLLVNIDMLRSGDDDREIGTLLTLRDADTRRQLQRQLDLSSRLAAIGRLTSGVAHEIKNPLNAMALHLEILKSKLEPNDPEILVISKEIKRLDNVVKTFLNFTKPVELQTKPLDVTELAREMADLIAPEARAHGVTIERDLSTPHWINGDADLFKQALLNVMVNGVEAMRDGGLLNISSVESSAGCEILVGDEGPGIPPEVRDKIFNLYFTTKASGSGIGLAMTFRLVQLHGGSIELENKPEGGTLFRLCFPAMAAVDEEHAVTAHS